jgi:UDP-N-acetylglucosamine--N-acetylmuramyl-(pentapeptide) pyrophosphoryl-undecaprenol N-acetylglucosamine transferase
MKILFTGGGSGGHFYPLIAVAGEMQKIAEQESLVGLKLYYAAPSPYNKQALFDNDIRYVYVPAGKIRNYFSILNFFDLFKTFFGILKALLTVFSIYPDVVVAKGGFASFPVLFASKLLRIPVIIHESDTVPGRTNLWASKFASRIAVSYPEAKKFFPKETEDKIAYTGQPVRPGIRHPAREGAPEYLKLEERVPTVFVMGGSLGASLVNNVILEALPQLVEEFQVIHQVGKNNINEVRETAAVILAKNPKANRYKPFDYLNDLAMRMSAGISDVVVTRGGSTLFEVAYWSKPVIIIPITSSINNHQRQNAYEYARVGGGVVLDEVNVSPSILISEIRRISGDPELAKKMGEVAHNEFARDDAARKIAMEALQIAISHVG